MSAEKKIALLGQPNSGKSTVFNMLTGAHQHVGNWPGKTVEKVEGEFTYDDTKYLIADLPGTYSLSANSDEETVTISHRAERISSAFLPIHLSLNEASSCFRTMQA